MLSDFHVFKPRYGGSGLNKLMCARGIHGERMSYWQCSRPGKLEHGGHKWCSQHYPPNVEKKEQERRKRWEREDKARTARWDRERALLKMQDAAVEACRKIADGHNDPVALARAVVEMDPDREKGDGREEVE